MNSQTLTALNAAALVFALSFAISMLVAGMVKVLYLATRFLNRTKKS
jgi:hypothetical protein